MPYPQFNLSRLTFAAHDSGTPVTTVNLLPVDAAIADSPRSDLSALGTELVRARNQGGATIFLCDADVLRDGVSLHLIDLMEKGLLTHLCIEPAGVLCDWEMAKRGRMSSTAVAQLASKELIGDLLDTLAAGDEQQLGVGEALGRRIHTDEFPHESSSLLAQGYRWGVPVTVHAAIGGALLHAADGFDPGCVGRMLHRDFLVLANSVENLDDGVVYQFGEPSAAVTVFLTAMTAARNVAAQRDREIADFTTAVFSPSTETESATVARTANEDRRHTVACSFADAIPALRQAALNFAGWNS